MEIPAADYPAFPLAQWRDTKETLHRFAQIVGKIRLDSSPRRNHWWHVPFHLTGRGMTTRPMRDATSGRMFTIDFDFVDHMLIVSVLSGEQTSFPLTNRSVADFYQDVLGSLTGLGIGARPRIARPFDLPDRKRPFDQDTEHHSYDPAAVNTYWRILSQVAWELEAFSSGYSGKISAVHHFWHTFDVAVTRFSDREIESDATTDPVTREAYSREVISSGFWFGDDEHAEPMFYSYTAPEPDGLAASPLQPAEARWTEQRTSHLALLSYSAVREAANPHEAIQGFYRSAFRAGADLAGWPAERECRNGVTDPQLA